jgi:hypothetical protein
VLAANAVRVPTPAKAPKASASETASAKDIRNIDFSMWVSPILKLNYLNWSGSLCSGSDVNVYYRVPAKKTIKLL